MIMIFIRLKTYFLLNYKLKQNVTCHKIGKVSEEQAVL